MCDMRAYTEFYACIKKFRITNKKKYNACLPVLDLCQYGHPYLHTLFPANEFILPYQNKTESCIYTQLLTDGEAYSINVAIVNSDATNMNVVGCLRVLWDKWDSWIML